MKSLCYCVQATFPTATTLVLQRPAATVASFRAAGRSTGEPTADFASAAPGARFVDGRGQWLGQPDALLQGSANGAQSDVLLTLSQPLYDAAAQVGREQVCCCRLSRASSVSCMCLPPEPAGLLTLTVLALLSILVAHYA